MRLDRRKVDSTLAQQFAEELRDAVSPCNFGMSIKGGMESLVHIIRCITDESPDVVVTEMRCSKVVTSRNVLVVFVISL